MNKYGLRSGGLPKIPLDFSWIIKGRLAAGAHPGRLGHEERYLKALNLIGFDAIVTLTSDSPNEDPLADLGYRGLHIPIENEAAPTNDQADRASEFIQRSLDDGLQVYTHCYAGYGRTGTILAAYLVKSGVGPFEAIDRVRRARPGAIETREQERFVLDFARAQRDVRLQDGEG